MQWSRFRQLIRRAIGMNKFLNVSLRDNGLVSIMQSVQAVVDYGKPVESNMQPSIVMKQESFARIAVDFLYILLHLDPASVPEELKSLVAALQQYKDSIRTIELANLAQYRQEGRQFYLTVQTFPPEDLAGDEGL